MNTSVELRQGTIHYRDEGEGDPLVFVHGLLVDGRLWRNVTPSLTRRAPLRRGGLAARLAPQRPARGRRPLTARNRASDRRLPRRARARARDDRRQRHRRRDLADPRERAPRAHPRARADELRLPGELPAADPAPAAAARARARRLLADRAGDALRPGAHSKLGFGMLSHRPIAGRGHRRVGRAAARARDPRRHDRDAEGDRQARHAGGGRAPRRAPAADAARVGARRPDVPAAHRRAARRDHPRRADRDDRRQPRIRPRGSARRPRRADRRLRRGAEAASSAHSL